MARKAASDHITDRGAVKLREAGDAIDDATGSKAHQVAGPSPNPMTNALIHDIALRSVGRLARLTVEKGLLQRRYGPDFAKRAIENRSTLHALAAYGVTKVATRSVPGALLVGGSVLAKTLFDRSQSRRKARRKGDRMIERMADQDGPI